MPPLGLSLRSLVGCSTASLELTNWTLCLDKLKIQFSHFSWTSNLVGWTVDCSTQSCMGLFNHLSQGIEFPGKLVINFNQ